MEYTDKDFDESGSRKDVSTLACAIITLGALFAVVASLLGLLVSLFA